MAAATAEGRTIIENAAEEPEIVDLVTFLNSMGANIKGAGTNIIRVEGVKELEGVSHTVIPDRIEAGTFMIGAAMVGGDVVIDNVLTEHLKPLLAKLNEAGVKVIKDIGLTYGSSVTAISVPPISKPFLIPDFLRTCRPSSWPL